MALDSALSSEAWAHVCEGLAGSEVPSTTDGFEDSFGSSDVPVGVPDARGGPLIHAAGTQGNSTHTPFPKTHRDAPITTIPETFGDVPARNHPQTLGDNDTIVTETKRDTVTRITQAAGDKVPEMQWGTQTLILATSLCNATSSSVNARQDGRAAPNSASGRLDDSAAYLALLESRLRRIKGQERAVSSREMVSSLAQARQECLDRLLHDDSSTEAFTEDNLGDGSLIQFRRWLAPERVAVTAEELEHLIPPVAMVENNSMASTNGGTTDKSAAAVSLEPVKTEEISDHAVNESEGRADVELPDTGP
ncbi:unnamed protein product [Lampetra planeri]